MTAGFARWCTEGAVVAALLALPGCGSTDEARQPTLWEQSDPLVKVAAPDPVVLPGEPGPGISITRLTLPTATAPATMEPGLSAQTLYADPDAAELLARSSSPSEIGRCYMHRSARPARSPIGAGSPLLISVIPAT
jgi:hypothetical protein